MVLNAHQRRIPFRHRVASHPHLHPGQVLDALGVVNGVHEVHAALIQTPVRVECDERRLVDARVVNYDLIVLATGDDLGVVAVPIGVPYGHIQRLRHVVVVAGAEFLLQVQRRLLRASRHRGIQNPGGEPRLQHLGFKPRCHVQTGDLLQGRLELGGVHVAVV